MSAKESTYNIRNVPPGQIKLPSKVKRVVVTPSKKGPLYLRAKRGNKSSAWFSLFPQEKWPLFVKECKKQGSVKATLEAKLDVDTFVIPMGTKTIEISTPAKPCLSVAAWTTKKQVTRTFLSRPQPIFLPVPFRSQMVETAVAPKRICLPTSLAMVLHFHGVNKTTATIARRTYDSHHQIYGNWIKACLTARSCGFSAEVQAMDTLSQMVPFLERGLPLVVSIGYEEGQLPGAPIASTKGHLIVVCGIDDKGSLICRDPAAKTRAKGEVIYDEQAFARAWKGMAIVVNPGS